MKYSIFALYAAFNCAFAAAASPPVATPVCSRFPYEYASDLRGIKSVVGFCSSLYHISTVRSTSTKTGTAVVTSTIRTTVTTTNTNIIATTTSTTSTQFVSATTTLQITVTVPTTLTEVDDSVIIQTAFTSTAYTPDKRNASPQEKRAFNGPLPAQLSTLKSLGDAILSTACSCVLGTISNPTSIVIINAGSTRTAFVTSTVTVAASASTISVQTVVVTQTLTNTVTFASISAIPSVATLAESTSTTSTTYTVETLLPPPLCSNAPPGQCTALTPCSDSNGSCACDLTTEGVGICTNEANTNCPGSGSSLDCSSSDECDPGWSCIISWCCETTGLGVCHPTSPSLSNVCPSGVSNSRIKRSRGRLPNLLFYGAGTGKAGDALRHALQQ